MHALLVALRLLLPLLGALRIVSLGTLIVLVALGYLVYRMWPDAPPEIVVVNGLPESVELTLDDGAPTKLARGQWERLPARWGRVRLVARRSDGVVIEELTPRLEPGSTWVWNVAGAAWLEEVPWSAGAPAVGRAASARVEHCAQSILRLVGVDAVIDLPEQRRDLDRLERVLSVRWNEDVISCVRSLLERGHSPERLLPWARRLSELRRADLPSTRVLVELADAAAPGGGTELAREAAEAQGRSLEHHRLWLESAANGGWLADVLARSRGRADGGRGALGATYLVARLDERARAAALLDRALEREAEQPELRCLRGQVSAAAGEWERALDALAPLRKTPPPRLAGCVDDVVAHAAVGAGHPDDALRWLERRLASAGKSAPETLTAYVARVELAADPKRGFEPTLRRIARRTASSARAFDMAVELERARLGLRADDRVLAESADRDADFAARPLLSELALLRWLASDPAAAVDLARTAPDLPALRDDAYALLLGEALARGDAELVEELGCRDRWGAMRCLAFTSAVLDGAPLPADERAGLDVLVAAALVRARSGAADRRRWCAEARRLAVLPGLLTSAVDLAFEDPAACAGTPRPAAGRPH